MSSPPREFPAFFKVYLPERSWDRLCIPTAFIEHFNGLVPKKAILRDFIGRVWHVEVGQTGKDVCFMNGWQQFLTDNYVEQGDFLVFRYDGNHIFDFKLFGRTACEKKEVNVDACKKDIFIKEEENVEEAEREEEKQEEEEDEEEDEEEEEEEEEEDEEEEEEDWTEEESSDEDEEDKMNDEKEEELRPKSSSNKKVVVSKHKYSGRGQPPIGGYKQTARVAYIETSNSKSKCKNPSCTQAELDNSFATASIVESKNPYFTTKLRPMRPSKLYVPLDVLKDHNITLPPKVLLRDPLGRSWPGDVSVWKDGRTWIGGWRSFCRWNHVNENDTCICELIQGRGHERDVIVVHIDRPEPRLEAPNCKSK